MKKEQILGVLRQVLTFFGAWLVARGLGDESLIQEIVGSITAVAATLWGWFDKSKRGLNVWVSLIRHLVSAVAGVLVLFDVSAIRFEEISGMVLGLLSTIFSYMENKK